MQKAPIPSNEPFRLQTLHDYSILDTLPEQEYEDITQLASQICGTPIAAISLVDENRQWFKSKIGLETDTTSRKDSFCAHAIIDPKNIFTIKDSRLDERFFDNQLVTGKTKLIFYAGIPLVTPEGFALGTLCVMDNKPKALNEVQLKSLKSLSNQVVTLFELRKSKLLLQKISEDLEIKNVTLEKFAHIAAHDIKSPLNNISGLTELLIADHSSRLDDEAKMFLEMLNTSSKILRNLVDGILEYSKMDIILHDKMQSIDLNEFFSEIINLLDPKKEYDFDFLFKNQKIIVNKVAIQQIFINLISNAIKYNDKQKVKIEIGFDKNGTKYEFSVSDNGLGISEINQEKIFNIFEVLSNSDRFGNKGSGIGLSTVKKLIEGLGGKISLVSQINQGTTFRFSLNKIYAA